VISNGGTVWVHPHGHPEQAVEATVEIVASNQRSIALKLAEKPVWVRIIDTGAFLCKDGTGIAMLLTRESIGPWEEITGGGHYEIEEEKPNVKT
jgi:hypothetical protein